VLRCAARARAACTAAAAHARALHGHSTTMLRARVCACMRVHLRAFTQHLGLCSCAAHLTFRARAPCACASSRVVVILILMLLLLVFIQPGAALWHCDPNFCVICIQNGHVAHITHHQPERRRTAAGIMRVRRSGGPARRAARVKRDERAAGSIASEQCETAGRVAKLPADRLQRPHGGAGAVAASVARRRVVQHHVGIFLKNEAKAVVRARESARPGKRDSP
jgi:hypothetical protein